MGILKFFGRFSEKSKYSGVYFFSLIKEYRLLRLIIHLNKLNFFGTFKQSKKLNFLNKAKN